MTRSAMSGVFRLTDQMWEKFGPLIPPRVNTHKFGGGPRLSGRDLLPAADRLPVEGAGRHGHLPRLDGP